MKKLILASICFAALIAAAHAQSIGPPASSGGTPGGSNTQLQYNNSSSFGGISGWTTNGTTQVTNTQAPAANTSTEGLILTDTTAATSGNQQYSPRIRLTGQGWKTNSTAASQTVDWIIETQPIQGTNNPVSSLAFSYQVNGGGYNSWLTINQLINGSANNIEFGNSGSAPALVPGVDGAGSLGTTQRRWAGLYNFGNTYLSNSAPLIEMGSSLDLILSRGGAAALQLGAGNAASPVNQTLQAQGSRVGTDSNVAGANLLIQPGVGTGNATPSALNFDTWVAVGSGSTTQTQTATLQLTAGNVVMPNLTTGTNADFLCLSSAGVVLVQTSACTISSLRFKPDWKSYDGDALDEVSRLDVGTFHTSLAGRRNADPNAYNLQVGLNAENVATIVPLAAIYEPDNKTPKSYRQEAIIALLVKAIQQQQSEISELKRRVR